MKNSSYTITPSGRYSSYQWILILGILLIVAYLYLGYDIYQEEGWSTSALINLAIAVIYAAVIYFNFTADSPHDEISFSNKGIRVSGDKKRKPEVIKWTDLQKISITNNALFLDFEDKGPKELNISYLKYDQLQEAKRKINSFCEQQQISFPSKY